MSFGILAAVLGAALLHASWNALIKTGSNKQTAMLIMTVWQGLIGLAVVVWLPFPSLKVWPWIIGSGLIHMCYQLFLAYAYEQGDLSRVYPLARGAAPMIVLAVSSVFLADEMAGQEVFGILVLGLGILLMARGVFTSGESRKLIPFALCSAMATAAYTIVDGIGARVEGDAVAYVGWLLLMAAVFYIPAVLHLKGGAVTQAPKRDWLRGAITASAALAAYCIVVWAMTKAPIALVAALRETSILFAVLIGWIVFGDRMDRLKWAAATLIVLGVILTRI